MSARQCTFIAGILAIASAAVVLLAIVICVTVVEYRNADTTRCVKGQVLLINGAAVQTCKADR